MEYDSFYDAISIIAMGCALVAVGYVLIGYIRKETWSLKWRWIFLMGSIYMSVSFHLLAIGDEDSLNSLRDFTVVVILFGVAGFALRSIITPGHRHAVRTKRSSPTYTIKKETK